MLTILYDGWALARQPNSAAALHLHHLLTRLVNRDVRALVALPAEPAIPLPEGIECKVRLTGDGERDHLRWEQRDLPRMGRETDADCLHLPAASAPLISAIPALVSPSSIEFKKATPDDTRFGFVARLRDALSSGGMARVQGILWPADLPDPLSDRPMYSLPACVHPAFNRPVSAPGSLSDLAALELPETFVLYHGPQHPTVLMQLLEAWSWAAGSIGAQYPLLVAGLDRKSREWFKSMLNHLPASETILTLPEVPVETLAAVYRRCSALFHPAKIPAWGAPLRLALACEKPVVALETSLADAIVGPAAYLIPENTPPGERGRALGAALITVLVEAAVAENLSREARQRAATWHGDQVAESLIEIYRSLK